MVNRAISYLGMKNYRPKTDTALLTNRIEGFKPRWSSPPRDTVGYLLDERGWTRAEFAKRTGYVKKYVDQPIKGDASITESNSLMLQNVLGSSERFWLVREAQYRAALGRVSAFAKESNAKRT